MTCTTDLLPVALITLLGAVGRPALAAEWSCSYNLFTRTETCQFADGGPTTGALPSTCMPLTRTQATYWESIHDDLWGNRNFVLVASAMTGQIRGRWQPDYTLEQGCHDLKVDLPPPAFVARPAEVSGGARAADMPDTVVTRLTQHIDLTVDRSGYGAEDDGLHWLRWEPDGGSAAMWIGIFAVANARLSPAELSFKYEDAEAELTVLGMSVQFDREVTHLKFDRCIRRIVTEPDTWLESSDCTGFTPGSVTLPVGLTYRVGGTLWSWRSGVSYTVDRPEWESATSPWVFTTGTAIIDPCGLSPRDSTRCAKSLRALEALGDWGVKNAKAGNFVPPPATSSSPHH